MFVFLDIGAHIGESSDFWLKHYPESKAICFEPLPANCKRIREKGYKVIQAAAWIRNEKIKFYAGLPESGSLYASKTTGGIDPNRFIDVEGIDLAEYIKVHLRKSDTIVIKMNCEGAEYNIIPHLRKHNLIEWVDTFYIQWHYEKIGVSKQTHDKVKGMIISSRWRAMFPQAFEKEFKKITYES
jgi:FkbM family methyltransferase